ncbi:proton-conducting transporter transmembrane domain-containing protein [Leucobacter soli]|uniref:proton-conducting transporter transmembrane domain-containing protein n=1 Tax=Leucobacter soli TaxID=2812850 RepID=UPI00361A2524
MMTTTLLALPIAAILSYPVIRRLGRRAFLAFSLVLGAVFVLFAFQGGAIAAGGAIVEEHRWVPQLDLAFTFRLDAVSWIFALLVTGAGALVLLYCMHYFEDGEEGLARFGSVFLGFASSMLGLVLSDNIYLMFVFWEGTTVFSFLLIGHMARQRTARSAALQALIVTTFGGLAMLVGLVVLGTAAQTTNLSEILADPPDGTAASVAVFLVLIGALSKSAIFPFHFWLPGAMAAPTPVSAYLHAAAMVKAGIYLIARLGPGFGDLPGFRTTLVVLGAVTMLNGGIRALRQYDIKQIVAHGTVSQLGLLVMVFGVSDPRTDFAGYALLLAHAVAKAPLFLAVGIIDHCTGTRDLRQLSGVGRRRPGLAVTTVLAAASMAGLPPLLGFVAKESVFTELMAVGEGSPVAVLAFAVALVGSVLTVAYMGRFLWGAFATKRDTAPAEIIHEQPGTILIAPVIFTALACLGGLAAPLLDPWLRLSAAEQPGGGTRSTWPSGTGSPRRSAPRCSSSCSACCSPGGWCGSPGPCRWCRSGSRPRTPTGCSPTGSTYSRCA